MRGQWRGGGVISTVCEATQNSKKFESNTQVLPSVYRTAGPMSLAVVDLLEKLFPFASPAEPLYFCSRDINLLIGDRQLLNICRMARELVIVSLS